MTKSTRKHSKRRRFLIIGSLASLLIVGLCVVIYFVLAPKRVDRDLFSYIKQPYAKQDVVYSYAISQDYSVAFARVSPEQAKAVLAGPSTLFPECHDKNSYSASEDKFRCSETWVSDSVKRAGLTTGMQNKQEMQAVQDAYAKAVTKDSFCTFSPNAVLWKDVAVKHTLCVNPSNGYVMYIYLNP